jgi:primosomal protein N' (replication factor Y) (superfamily II helicase)
MVAESLYADIILPFPLNQLFTYIVPKDLISSIEPGKRVIVQFGSRKYYTGIIVKAHSKKPADIELKEIISVIDTRPIVNELNLEFWQWIADYYMCSAGEVMNAALPAGLKLESETRIFYNHLFDESEILTETESMVLTIIRNNKELVISKLQKMSSRKNIFSIVKSLYEKNAILVDESLKRGYTQKIETYVRLTIQASDEDFLNDFIDKTGNARKQREIIYSYVELSGVFAQNTINEVKKKNLIEFAEVSSAVLKGLVKKGIFEEYSKEVSRIDQPFQAIDEMSTLSDAQQSALNEIENAFKNKDVVLLHGITSSGKTEIYFHLIKKVIDEGKQVLYLLPEIAITVQIINRLRVQFGNKVGIYHSKFSDNERVEIWNRLNSSGPEAYQVVLGVRSSVFLPFSDLGLIIVDEEHENTFKQFDPAPRYNARDSAIMLGKMHHAKVILGSATPSLESYYNASTKKYGLVELNERYRQIMLPEVRLVNLRAAQKRKSVKLHFSDELIRSIERCIAQSKQVILFQNRRGFSPYIECSACGWIPHCRYCDVTLTYHKYQNHLMCHYCGYSMPMMQQCSECKSTGLQMVGLGTERIEEELAILFPKAQISRLDLDSTSSKHAHDEIISKFENGKIDILIGTQMVTKGLDFDRVGLVGILNADLMLNYPDFRAFERSFQLMVQVSGRAGRKDERGLVIIQTYSPAHPIIRQVISNNFKGMYNEQIAERMQFKYPPVYRLIKITVKHKNGSDCENASNQLANNLREYLHNRVIGPDIPVISRIQNYYLRNIYIKIEKSKTASEIKPRISEMIKKVNEQYKSVRIVTDVDPM